MGPQSFSTVLLLFLGLIAKNVLAEFQDKIFFNSTMLFVRGNTFELRNPYKQNSVLKFSINNAANVSKVTQHLPQSENKFDFKYQIQLDSSASFFIEPSVPHPFSSRELSIRWESGPKYSREVCFHYGFNNASWYSTYEEIDQRFPMDVNKVQKLAPFQTNDYFQGPFGSVLETIFLNSDGFAIQLHDGAPAMLRRDPNNGDPIMCVTSDRKNNYLPLEIDIQMGESVREIYDRITRLVKSKISIPKPTGIPDRTMFRDPVWSTWVQFKKDVTQEKVLQFAHEVYDNKFPASQIEIDDKWEKYYGDMTFDAEKFPDPAGMVAEIKKLGFPTTLWIHPFVNEDSDVYKKFAHFFVQNDNSTDSQHIKWWDGKGAIVDFSNPDAVDWFVGRLEHLKNVTGIDSFKFDAGERFWEGAKPHFYDSFVQIFQNRATTLYVKAVARLGSRIEVRSSFRNQDLPIFTRLMDRQGVWEEHNGLRSVITGALTFALAGYSFILPDMIGGNGKQPSAELYVRWVQATALLPSVQFSITPWRYENDTIDVVNITRHYVELHRQFTPLIIELAKERVETGEPTIRPMWWLESLDPRTYTIGDQFMLGNQVVVAPVMIEKARERNVYLPRGEWKSPKGAVLKGPAVHLVKAELDELPYFVRVGTFE